ncbi:MAG: chromosomal replication initiator protein DnaA [Alphaproteobacteria bacterium]|nr:chromosomal replication initiator protein DnaA [Alphaproteobacteria bacterium]
MVVANKTAPAHSANNVWGRICGQMRNEIGDVAFKSWLEPMSLGTVCDSEVKLCVPTRFMRDWVMTHYAERIKSLWSKENPSIQNVDFIIRKGTRRPAPSISHSNSQSNRRPTSAPVPPKSTIRRPAKTTSQSHAPSPFETQPQLFQNRTPSNDQDENYLNTSARLDERFTFDNFIVGKPNEFAYAAAKKVAETTDVAFNPLFLYSGVGLGKTHLMHAIAWEIQNKNPSRNAVYLSAEKFMYRFVRALRYKDTMAFKEQFRSVDVLMIDDIQFISGKDSTQEEFFHTFNALVDQGKQIIVSSDKSPAELDGIEDRLRSRLGYGLVADIHPTNYELRLGILEAKAEQLGQVVPSKVIEFLAHKISTNVRELEGALQRVIAHAQLIGKEITLESTQSVLSDLLRTHDRQITIEEIKNKVSEHFNISPREMSSQRRSQLVARPRQIAMFLSKLLTTRSLPQIGREFGGRDHTTVMYAVKKITDLCNKDKSFAEDVELLKRMLGN